MVDFFEFDKKSSDGIRRKGLPNAVSKGVTKKHVESPKPAPEEVAAIPILFHKKAEKQKNTVVAAAEVSPTLSSEELSFPAHEEEEILPQPVRKKTTSPKAHLVSKVNPLLKLFSRTTPVGMSEASSGLSLPEEIKKDKKSRLLRWGVIAGAAVVIMGGIMLSFQFSHLTITMTSPLRRHDFSGIKVVLDRASLSASHGDTNVLPAELLEFSRTEKQEFTASGQKNVIDRAHGIARIYNNFNASPQKLVAQTRFTTQGGRLYRLLKAVQIPAATTQNGKITPQFVEAELVADEVGESGNGDGEITLKIPGFKGTPRYDGFYAVVSNGFHGGFKGDSKVATKEDIKSAEEEVTKKLFDEIKVDIAKKIPTDFKVVDGLRVIEIRSVSGPRENEAGERFSVEAEATGRVLVFRESDIASVLQDSLLKDSPDQEGINEAGLKEVVYGIKNLDIAKGKAELTLGGVAYGKSSVSEKDFAALLTGKPIQTLVQMLNDRKDVTDVSVQVFPPWVSSAPSNSDRISVIIRGN